DEKKDDQPAAAERGAPAADWEPPLILDVLALPPVFPSHWRLSFRSGPRIPSAPRDDIRERSPALSGSGPYPGARFVPERRAPSKRRMGRGAKIASERGGSARAPRGRLRPARFLHSQAI